MGLESASYITDLVVTNPLGTDGKSQGDNHIRLIKQVLTNQFPNLGSAAVTGTAAELNEAVAASTPEGGIIMWAGTTAQVPTGWQLCNGVGTTNNLSIPVPNLASKFIVGSVTDTGGTYDIGDTGGDSTHTHAVTGGDHTHTVSRDSWGVSGTKTSPSSSLPAGRLAVSSGEFEINEAVESYRNAASDKTTSSTAHTHTVGTVSNEPPYYALAFIMYLG